MRKTILGLVAIAAVAAPLAFAASANAATTLTNLSFEERCRHLLRWGTPWWTRQHQTLTDWTVGGAGVDIVGNACGRPTTGHAAST